MDARIVAISPRLVRGFREALDSVAREGRYLAMLEAPPLAAARAFVRSGLRTGSVHYVALVDGSVVGWCDVMRPSHAQQRHSGTLGMGVVAGHRGRGLGRRLLETTLARADALGLERVELRVRTDNVPAIRLYEAAGFASEGLCRRYLRTAEGYRDALLMARLA